MTRRMGLLLAVLLLVAGLLWLDGGAAGDDLALPTTTALRRDTAAAARASDGTRSAAVGERTSTTSAPVAVLAAREVPDRGGRRSYDLFAAKSWAQAPAVVTAPVVASSADVKAVPALPFVYIGRQRAAGVDQVFLAENEVVHVVQHDSVIRGLYKVQEIAPGYVQLLYMPMNHVHRIQTGTLD